jgi:hypothetical protein
MIPVRSSLLLPVLHVLARMLLGSNVITAATILDNSMIASQVHKPGRNGGSV